MFCYIDREERSMTQSRTEENLIDARVGAKGTKKGERTRQNCDMIKRGKRKIEELSRDGLMDRAINAWH